jgi:hypothetical protein
MASKRGYITAAQVNESYGFTPTDAQINQAEEIIDDYVGFQDKFLDYEIRGLLAAGGQNNFTLEAQHQNNMQLNYLRGCWIEIIGGTGEGELQRISKQGLNGVITVEAGFTTTLDTTSYYKIYQLGKFPRQCDVEFDGIHQPQQYYKAIPQALRQAVAAQVHFINEMGDAFFATDKNQLNSETIGDYSYTKGSTASVGRYALVAPAAKGLLRGLVNRAGSF